MSRRRPFVLAPVLALAVAALAACATDDAGLAPVPPDTPGERVPLTRFRAEPYSLTYTSGIGEPTRAVVRDDPLWQATWVALGGSVSPRPEAPAVDFAREMVVVAALGTRASGGYGVLVDSATMHGGTLRVHVRTLSAGAACAVIAMVTRPADAARLPRHDGPVEFRERAEVVRCD